MKKLMILSAGIALLGFGNIAHADCAAVCDQTTTVACDGSETVSHVLTECGDPSPGGPEVCGQVCVDGVIIVGGWAGFATPDGCIEAGGAIGTTQALGGNCSESAVAACESNGCAESTDGEGSCPAGVRVRSSSTENEENC